MTALGRLFNLQSLRAAITNVGGMNLRSHRFAGELVNAGVTEHQRVQIFHSLIFSNGVRKTTARGRNGELISTLLDTGKLSFPPRVRVLDIGASMGLDALGNFEIIGRHTQVAEYVIGDLFTRLYYDRERGLLFDEDRSLIQVRRCVGFVATNFAYNFQFQRLLHLPKRFLPWYLTRVHRFDPSRRYEEILLVHPLLNIGRVDSPFKLKRLNVFEPLGERFEFIVCLHLLVPRYFSSTQISAGVENLKQHLAIGGSLLVGAAEDYQLIVREAEECFRVVR